MFQWYWEGENEPESIAEVGSIVGRANPAIENSPYMAAVLHVGTLLCVKSTLNRLNIEEQSVLTQELSQRETITTKVQNNKTRNENFLKLIYL